MGSYLGLALYAEGPTDHRFLAPLLLRAVEDRLLAHGADRVDVGAVISLLSLDSGGGGSREERISEAAREATGAFHLLFVHSDGAGDPARARQEQAEPGLRRAGDLVGQPYAGVAVIPVREMEAWALADGNALRRAFGTNLGDAELGVPKRARGVERIADPKRALEVAFQRAVGGALRARNRPAASFLALIAEAVHLRRLCEVPSFQQMVTEIDAALRHLRFIA